MDRGGPVDTARAVDRVRRSDPDRHRRRHPPHREVARLGDHTNPKRKRGRPTHSSLALRVGVVRRRTACSGSVAVVPFRRCLDRRQPANGAILTFGTAVGILKMLRMPDQTLRVMVQGLKRIRVKRIQKKDGYYTAHIEVIEEEFTQSDRMEALTRAISEKFKKIV